MGMSCVGFSRVRFKGIRLHPSHVLALLLVAATANAQTRVLTSDDYARAERFVGYNATPLVDHAVTTVTWLDDHTFWYRDHDADGDHFLQMDAASGKATPAFDHDRLAKALARAGAKPVRADKLPISEYTLRDDGGFDISVRGKHYLCDRAIDACAVDAAGDGVAQQRGWQRHLGHRACRHHPPARQWLAAAGIDHGQGTRWQDRPVRPDVQTDALRCLEKVSDHRLHLSRSADGIGRQPQLQRGA